MEALTTVLTSRAATPTAHVVRLAKPEGFAFKAGQYVVLKLRTPEGWDDRFLSIACAPHRPHLEFAVRVGPSPFKQAFAALRPGDEVALSGPTGRFQLDEGPGRAVLVCGGIGITPLKAMAEHATEARMERPVVLVASHRDASEILFRDELDALRKANPRLDVLLALTRPGPGGVPPGAHVGRIDEALLRRAGAFEADAVGFVCGPPGFVKGLVGLLRGLGLGPGRIKVESFTGYE